MADRRSWLNDWEDRQDDERDSDWYKKPSATDSKGTTTEQPTPDEKKYIITDEKTGVQRFDVDKLTPKPKKPKDEQK